MTELSFWKKCSTCRDPIAFSAEYLRCSVSTCNKKRAPLVFCSMVCWDAHQAESRHRDAWAEPERAPTREARELELAETAARNLKPVKAPTAPKKKPARRISREVLVVASKLKDYIRSRSGMSTSDGVFSVLSDDLRAVADRACDAARKENRKTVLDRDVLPLFTHEGRSLATGEDPSEDAASLEVLVVTTKLKSYIKEASDMNTSDGVLPILSEHLRHLARKAIRAAGADGRKTVLDRDFLPSGAGDET